MGLPSSPRVVLSKYLFTQVALSGSHLSAPELASMLVRTVSSQLTFCVLGRSLG